tara:strand:- start:4486 stop:5103 length:618 start_codon:yes stop_codon:yes gene_type:complete
MKPLEMLNQVKELLGVENESSVEEKIELAQMKLENGTVIEAESFEKDQPIFIVTEEDKVALPVGDYKLEDGKILVIKEEGIISDIMEESEESEESEEIESSEQLEEEEVKAEYVTRQELKSAVDEIKAMIEDMKKEKEEMSEEVAEEVGLAVTEMLSKNKPVELEESEKVSHNPEGKEEKKFNLYAKKRQHTVKDRVLNRILNLN